MVRSRFVVIFGILRFWYIWLQISSQTRGKRLQYVPSRLLDRELDRELLLGLLSSSVCASASGLVCALGVADQSLVIGAIDVCRGGGELGLFEILCKTYYHR